MGEPRKEYSFHTRVQFFIQSGRDCDVELLRRQLTVALENPPAPFLGPLIGQEVDSISNVYGFEMMDLVFHPDCSQLDAYGDYISRVVDTLAKIVPECVSDISAFVSAHRNIIIKDICALRTHLKT